LTYAINLSVTGNSALNVVVTDTLPANVTFGSFLSSPPGTFPFYNPANSSLSWTLPSPLAAGNYQLTYQTTIANFVPAGTVLTNNAQLTYTGLAAPVSTSVNVTVTGDYTVLIGVYNEAGELVKQVAIAHYSQPVNDISLNPNNTITSLHGPNNSIQIYYLGHLIGTWDGSDANGNPATNGVYHIKVDNISSTGSVTSTIQQAVISRTLYKSTILVYNEAGEVVRHLFTYTDDPGKGAVLGVTLSTTLIQPGSLPAGTNIPTQVKISLSNGTNVFWDGKSDTGSVVQTGQYFVEVHSLDGKGGETMITQRVTVQDVNANAGVGIVTAQPNVLSPSNGTITTFKSSSALALTLKVSIYTLAGELVGIGQGPAGTNQTSWDAHNMASGLYIAVVELIDANGGLVGHQTVKIAILH
jgi:hypothetical protein